MTSALSLSQASIYLESPLSDALVRTPSFSFSLSEDIPSDSASPSKTSSPSLYAAFKVLTLVNTFRKRLKTLSQVKRKLQSKKNTNRFCQDFERRAFEEIDRYLGRKPKGIRTRRSEARDIEIVAFTLDSSRESINGLLDNINASVNLDGPSLSTLASDNDLFLKRQSDFHIKRLSIKELQHLVIHVKDLLETLRRAAPPDRTFPQDKADPTLSLTYLSNLEHLLLCLQQQLFGLFIVDCIELVRNHIIECQKDHERYYKEWFFEYPDAQHPLSTTWPWAIKPSLAVLWGVCWMFFANYYIDDEMNCVDNFGTIVVPRDQLYEIFIQQHLQSQNTANPGYGDSRQSPRLMPPQPRPLIAEQMVAQRQAALPSSGSHFYTHALHRDFSSGDHAFQAADLHRVDVPTSNTHAQPPLNASTDYRLPEDNIAAQQQQHSGLGIDYNAHRRQGQAENYWQLTTHPVPTNQRYSQSPLSQQCENSCFPRGLPHHQSGHVTSNPAIRVTPESSNIQPYSAQPQELVSASSYFAPSNALVTSTEPQYLSPLSPLSPQRPRRTSSPGMATMDQKPPLASIGPVSPSMDSLHHINIHNTPRHSPLPESMTRKRSYSEMSQPQMQQTMQLQQHEEQSPRDPTNDASLSGVDDNVKQKSVRRLDPPMTNEGKYYCNYSNECGGQLFDRKCEWSKHMDKHDRPYRCPQPHCAKLQGFTYSGGLLRHEREVHGKHGGPKEQLRCTVQDCKRHTGKGFTRKENLNEHLRRVHGIIITDGAQLRQIAANAVPGAEAVETPASRFSDNHEMDEFTGISPPYPMPDKRRRLDATSPHSASDEFENELARLRSENVAKDERIQRVEQEHAETQQRLRTLEIMLGQLTQNGLSKAEAEAEAEGQV